MMEKARKSTGWLRISVGKRDPVGLLTTLPIPEEIFAALEYYSENPGVGTEFLAARGTPKPTQTFHLFHSFIRQGRTFFEAGAKLHFRASALMYYYSFLNLAKAYITLFDPNFVQSFVGHGLSLGKFSEKPLKDQSIKLHPRIGVFQKYYELETGQTLPAQLNLGITNLLGYCSDIKAEFEKSQADHFRVLPLKVRMFSHQAQQTTWPVLAILDFDRLRPFKKSLSGFWDYFHEVEPNPQTIRQTFDIGFPEITQYTFLESRKLYLWEKDGQIDIRPIKSDIQNACASLIESPIYDDGFDANFILPMRKNYQIPMRQSLAIHAVMFFVGSLVRYQPDYLENLLSSTDAWMLERFVRSSATSYLRSIANSILDVDYLYSSR